MQLSMVLKAVVSQQLLPCTTGGQVAAFEVMLANLAVQNMIREEKIHQIDSVIFSGAKEGMVTMDNSLFALYQSGRISAQDAILHSTNYDAMNARIGAADK